jgi:hypothetical protein
MENDSMTDRGPPYHNAAIDGETPETRDPRHNTGVIPLAKKIPGSTGEVGAPAGPSGIHPVATLYFDSLDAIKAGVASPQGQAAAGDLATLRTGARSPIFLIQRTFERGATDNVD